MTTLGCNTTFFNNLLKVHYSTISRLVKKETTAKSKTCPSAPPSFGAEAKALKPEKLIKAIAEELTEARKYYN